MASSPNPKSYNQILGDQLGTFISKTGIARIKIANPILSIFESVSQSQLRTSADIFQLLASENLDNATGQALVRIGNQENVTKLTSKSSTGYIIVTDTSFTKISDQIYQGTGAPISGSSILNIQNASAFPSTGSIYIGRNTNNYEGPIAYTAKANVGSYWTLTLSTPTTKFHNLGESVIVAQGGNRTVNAGSVVQTAQGNTTSAVQFKTLYTTVLPDGETTSSNVLVASLQVGTSNNIDEGAIQGFSNPPFTGATATNPNAFTNGRDTETDPQYRERIRLARQTRGLGTKLAIQNAALGVSSADENKTVISTSYITKINSPDVLYIDDGTGYEELPVPINYEVLVASAIGGEQYISTSSPTPVTKAFLETSLEAPFSLQDGASLSVIVGNSLSVHTFDSTLFQNISNASAYEVCASINSDSNCLFSARTADDGQSVSITAKQTDFERLQILSGNTTLDANDSLGFPLVLADTLKLYKNGVLLTKDGAPAILTSNLFGSWGVLSGYQTLILSIDNTPQLTFTFTDSDFVNANTGFGTLGNNSIQSWASVINAKIPGITAIVTGSRIQLESNSGNSSSAVISIVGGSLITNNVFITQTATGLNNDYSFDRNLGQIELASPLNAGDSLTVGTTETRSFIKGSSFISASPSAEADFWFGIDRNYSLITTGVVNTSNLTVNYSTNSTPWAYQLRVGSTANVFSNVLVDDQLIAWDGGFNTTLQNSWRVINVDPLGTWVELTKPNCRAKRSLHASVKMSDGRIFCAGGYDAGSPLTSAEIYSPVTNTWVPVAPMNVARGDFHGVQLTDGRILVVGGYTNVATTSFGVSYSWQQVTTNTAEIYDPTANTWTLVTNHPHATGVASFAIAKINSGTNVNKILVASGESIDSSGNFQVWNDSYIYDPTANTWTASGNLTAVRSEAAFCTLGNGNLLLAGGYDASTNPIATCEYYNITSGTWTATSNNLPNPVAYANILWNAGSGFAELFGGYTTLFTSVSNSLSRYNPSTNTWSTGATTTTGMSKGVWTLMTNGYIAAIGDNGSGVQACQIYNSTANTWSTGVLPPSSYNMCFARGYEIATNKLLISHGHPASFTTNSTYEDTAISFICDLTTPASGVWSYTDPSIGSVSLSNGGLIFVRTDRPVIKKTIAAGNNYTASAIAALFNAQFSGATTTTYKTSSLKFITNTEGLNGSIGLISANSYGQLFAISTNKTPISNTQGHSGSVESLIGEISTPLIGGIVVRGVSDRSLDTFVSTSNTLKLDSGSLALYGMTALTRFSTNIYNFGQNRWSYNPILTQYVNQGLYLRSIPSQVDLSSNIHLMQPFKLSAYDTLSVLVDNDTVSNDYNINMWRTLIPTSNTYTASNSFTDGDNQGLSLANAFGYSANSFNFNDFAVHMAARTKTFPSDSTKSILYRFNKLGPDGNNSFLEYSLPTSANLACSLNVLTDKLNTNAKDIIQVQLASGAASTGISVTPAGYIGIANIVNSTTDIVSMVFVLGFSATTAVRTSNVTTVTLSLPAGVTDHGIAIGNYIYFSGSGSFPGGNYQVINRTTSTISYTDTGADVTSVGITATVSRDVQATSFATASPAIATGSFFRVGTVGISPSLVSLNKTIRISALGTQYITGVLRYSDYPFSSSSAVIWYPLQDTSQISAFANPAQTATVIANNFLKTSTTNYLNAVNATVLGSGTGVIDRSTAEQENNGDFYYSLTDGLNFVQTTTTPASVSQNYTLLFKDPVSASLNTGADWQNEVVRIVPVTTKNSVDWLNCTGVTGLSSVTSVQRSSRAEKVQITTKSIGSAGSVQVLGGTANQTQTEIYGSPMFSATKSSTYNYAAFKVKTSEAQNLISGQQVLVTNSLPITRPGPFNAGNSNLSISAANGLVYSSTALFNSAFSRTEMSNLGFEVLENGYVCVYGITNSTSISSLIDGWIYIDQPALNNVTNISTLNCGLFRIIQSQRGGIIINNPNAINQYSVSAGVVVIRNFKELTLPGDYLNINTNILGNVNVGNRQILSVGASYAQLSPGSISRTGSTVTVNTPYFHGLQVGNNFTITPGETNFTNKVYTVATVISTTSFTYTDAGLAGTNSIQETMQGFMFQNPNIFRVDTSQAALQSITGFNLSAANGNTITITEGSPEQVVKNIVSIIPTGTQDASGEGFSWIKLTPFDVTASTMRSTISQEAGSTISALTKFQFPTSISVGVDGYHYSGGLIEEVSKVIYGDESDPTTYPGVVAGGNSVEISGPYVRRIQVALSIRLRAFTPESSVVNKVKSGVTAVINNSPIGQNIAISDIIDAASKVTGVLAVTFDSPIYNNENDSIIINEYEKPLIINADSDVKISVIGE